MYFFQPVAEINTFLFRSEFPVLTGYCCKRAAFFQSIIHKPDMLYILITGKRRICNNLSVTTYTVFGKVFIKQYYVAKGVKKFSVFRHQLITFNYYRRTSSVDCFNKRATPGTRLQYRIILTYSPGKHNQPVGNIGRSLKKLVFLLKVTPLTFFQNGKHTFRIKRKCETLYLPTLP